jgi:hypothetical protein
VEATAAAPDFEMHQRKRKRTGPFGGGTSRTSTAPCFCWCGCGQTTKRRFAPGHDARFHGLAKKVARGEAEWPAQFVHDDAEADFKKWCHTEKCRHDKREHERERQAGEDFDDQSTSDDAESS